MNRVQDKVALVTGAARGQGRSHAVHLAREGADIIAIDACTDNPVAEYALATPADLAETQALVEAEGRRIITVQADVRDLDGLRAGVDAAVAELGGLDIAVANAGIVTHQEWDDITPELWETVLAVNLTGVWHTCQVAVPHLLERGGGSLILTSSTAGLKGMAFLVPYAASKHGVVGIMRGLSNELAQQRVRVNSIHPGGVQTPMVGGGGMMDLLEKRPHLRATFQNTMDLPPIDPSAISNAVVFLASDESQFITGVTLPVDAGTMAV